jgi:MFS transporter, Spinster family, sphingosine-1-phosphate transporter
VFSVSALPFGIISDLKSRKTVIAWGTALFSAFTSLGGLVEGFFGLFVSRAVVGVGEAAYGPASNSLVADYFPGKNRAFAMGILNAGIPVGGVLGILLGGWLASLYGWRVAFLTVGLPGFLLAALVTRLVDPTRTEPQHTIRSMLQSLRLGVRGLARQLAPLLIFSALGVVLALLLEFEYAISSLRFAGLIAISIGLGAAINIRHWVRLVEQNRREETPFTPAFENAVDEMVNAGHTVLRTPTLVFVFVAGAMISFGLNGLVGWGPSYMTRQFGLDAAQAAALMGKWGLLAGVSGTLSGGFIADWLGRWTRRSRVIVSAIGFLAGGPIALWVLTVHDLRLFVPGFVVGFFFLSWYNGPITAIIFDVVPPRLGATVVGAFLLFIHLAGDAIAFPLVGALSDRFGLTRAVALLPLVALLGGVVTLGALRTITSDMDRMARRTSGTYPVPPT